MKLEIGSKTRFLLAASFLGTAAESMLVPIYAPLAHRAGGSIVDAGIGFAFFSITTGVFVTTVGMTQWFLNNIHKLLVMGFLLAGLADLGYIFVQNRLELFLVQSVIGLSLGILNPAWDSLYSASSEDPTRKWAVWTGGVNLVTGFSALAGTYLLHHHSFNVVFAAMFLLDLSAACCSLIAIRSMAVRLLPALDPQAQLVGL
jgi:hypothetical protein